VESSIYVVVLYKNRFPELNYSQLEDALQRVAGESHDSSISYKAQLAYMYLSHGSVIELTPMQNPNSHDYLFKQISEQLEQKFLAIQE